jgi:pyrroloquinoline quinone biosynthesis protein D
MSTVSIERPALALGVRLHWDRVRERNVLLFPEGTLTLNQTAVDVLELCDGRRSVEDIAAVLSARYSGADVQADVQELLGAIADQGLVVDAGA